jgi:hypothetical protein
MATLGWFELGTTGVFHLYVQQRASGRSTWSPICSWGAEARTGIPKTRSAAGGHEYCVACLERVTSPAPIG